MKEQIHIIESLLKKEGAIAADQNIRHFTRQHGGSINDSFLVDTGFAKFFVKLNRRRELKGFFDCERKGLELLKGLSGLKIPNVIAISEGLDISPDILILEFLQENEPSPIFWKNFGQELAALHQNTDACFGLDYDNYIGSLVQSNHRQEKWVDFFIESRLNAQYKLARDRNFLDEQFGKELHKLFNKLEQLIPEEKPSLLHGDLWSGNYRVVGAGQAAVFDPAVYYGHREVDLAMMHLFGGFHHSLFDAYHQVFPLQMGWEERIDLFNLYPLLVHVNLFAGSYASRAKQVLKKFL